jgi:ferredoxin-NADP reductase
MTPTQAFAARLTGSISLSAQVRHLEFEMKGLPNFRFVPGQWLSFKQRQMDGEEITRPYYIASPPARDNRFALCLNRVQDGFMSNFLCDMKEGDEISCEGPSGDFILKPPLKDTIFIATSTGIAPFRSMLHWLLSETTRHQDNRFWLLFGSRWPDTQTFTTCPRSAAAARNGKACAVTCRNILRRLRKAGLICTPTSAASTK